MRQHPRSRKSYAFTLKEVHKHEKLIKVILKRRKKKNIKLNTYDKMVRINRQQCSQKELHICQKEIKKKINK